MLIQYDSCKCHNESPSEKTPFCLNYLFLQYVHTVMRSDAPYVCELALLMFSFVASKGITKQKLTLLNVRHLHEGISNINLLKLKTYYNFIRKWKKLHLKGKQKISLKNKRYLNYSNTLIQQKLNEFSKMIHMVFCNFFTCIKLERVLPHLFSSVIFIFLLLLSLILQYLTYNI